MRIGEWMVCLLWWTGVQGVFPSFTQCVIGDMICSFRPSILLLCRCWELLSSRASSHPLGSRICIICQIHTKASHLFSTNSSRRSCTCDSWKSAVMLQVKNCVCARLANNALGFFFPPSLPQAFTWSLYVTQGVFTRPQIIQMDGVLRGKAQVSRTSFCEPFHHITHHYFLHCLHVQSYDRYLSDVAMWHKCRYS